MADPNAAGILVVDDEQFFRQVLRDMVESAGYRLVAEAATGDGAVEMYRQFAPELVLMDIYMPDKNGIEATREIMALDPAAKILICSGSGYEDDINAAIQAGACGIIYKPFFDEEVIGAIRTHLAA